MIWFFFFSLEVWLIIFPSNTNRLCIHGVYLTWSWDLLFLFYYIYNFFTVVLSNQISFYLCLSSCSFACPLLCFLLSPYISIFQPLLLDHMLENHVGSLSEMLRCRWAKTTCLAGMRSQHQKQSINQTTQKWEGNFY
jgi:hypothetical protein